MEDSIQTIIIQITTITILLIGLLLVVITFIASVKRQIQEKALFDLELVFLQKKIDQQILEINTCRNNYDNTWSGYRKFTIQKKEFEKNSGVCSFYLVPHDGKAIPGFSPGQHLFININIPGHDKDFLRCYSISSSPSIKEYYRISFNKALPPIDMPTAPAGIVSSFFYDTLKQDDIIDVRAPSGKFFLDILSHKPVVLVAGGIGIAPLLSMLDAISDSTAQRETWFFLSVTNKQNHFMQAHVAKVADEHEHIHLYICYSHPQPEDIQGHDYDHAGRVNLALLKKYLPSNNFEFY
ncbi:MAG: hypothetical protein KAR12_02665, partial [Methylococcales bacterium]|nr:hypothetical protein [Methylococcales bacterium]